jgi:orotate phosphoribosyltransferase-like protein
MSADELNMNRETVRLIVTKAASQYDPETKHQSLEWHSKGSPRPQKVHMAKSKVKCMLVCFFDSTDVVQKEWFLLDSQ